MWAPLFYPSMALMMGIVLSLFYGFTAFYFLGAALGVIIFKERGDIYWRCWRWRGMVLMFGFCWGLLHREEETVLNQRSLQIKGVICSEVKRRSTSQSFDFKGEISGEGNPGTIKCLFVTTTDRREFRWGDRLEIRGRLVDFREPRNPGEFNEKKWHRLRGVYGQLRAQEIRCLESPDVFFWGSYFLILRERAKRYLSAGDFGTKEEQTLIHGMVLGDTEEMSQDLKERFRSTGTGHIFAVSGQNLGVLLILLLILLRFLKLNQWRCGVILLIPLALYSGVSGFQSSCIRAWIMLAFVLIAWRIDRPTNWLNFWSATLMMILIGNPLCIQDLGFQLSFLVVLGLIVVTPWAMRRLNRFWRWEPLLSKDFSTPIQQLQYRWRKELMGMGLSSVIAFFAVLPHSIFVFHHVNGGSILLNLLIVPLAGIIVMGGSMSFLVGGIHLSLSAVMNFFLHYFAKVVLTLVHTASLMTWTQMEVCDLREWRWGGVPQIVLLDLGEVPQGIIRYRGGIWLVNTGSQGSYQKKLRQALKYYGVSGVDGVFLTTVSESSNGGLIQLLEDYDVRRLIRPEQRSRSPLEKKWDQSLGEREFERWDGGVLSIGDKDFQVFGKGSEAGGDLKVTEDQGWVLHFEFRGRNLIWGNRISARRERELMAEKEIEVEVLVQGRNPRERHLSEDWLRHVNPRYLIVSDSRHASSKAGHDSRGNLRERTEAEVIFLEKTGALILDWEIPIMIRSWRDSKQKF